MAGTLEEALGIHYKFVIDADLRTIRIPSDMVFGVYFDRNVQTIDFEMPRYYHGDLDLSEFGILINYIAGQDSDIYVVTDQLYDDDKITFSWTVGIQAFLQNGGKVTFAVCLRKVNSQDEIVKEFNTTIHTITVLPGLEVEVDPADIPAVKDYLSQISLLAARVNKIADDLIKSSLHVDPIKIYCWGDSLTEGVGGYVMQPDNTNAYMAYSYPAWLGMTYNVVNLGARGEDIYAIMARQGADPIVLENQITIPASKDTPVAIGSMSNIFTYGAGTGLRSKSGHMVKINKEVESPGLNPCYINGVEGVIYRVCEATYPTLTSTHTLYFRRLEDGDPVVAAAGTEVETKAMRDYRNGAAIIWMGANGGYSSHQDFVQKVQAMVDYGKYNNYLVILSREFAEQYAREIMQLLTDDEGFCHVIYLKDILPWRGYMMAGIGSQPIDTSGWQTTDPIKRNAPLLCEYLQGQTGENCYGELHYSSWGYKAIAKLIQEKLAEMNLGDVEDEPSGDDYGTYLYKLKRPRTLNGTSYINTKVKLYDDVSKNWTIAIKYHGTVEAPNGVPYMIFCCQHDGVMDGLTMRYYLPNDDQTISPSNTGVNILAGSGGFNVGSDNSGGIDRTGTNIAIVSKNGDAYSIYVNRNTMAYGSPLVYALTSDKAHELPCLIGARWSSDGTEAQYLTGMAIDDIRIYDSNLDDATAKALYAEMAG